MFPPLTELTGRRTRQRGRSWTARREHSGMSIDQWWVTTKVSSSRIWERKQAPDWHRANKQRLCEVLCCVAGSRIRLGASHFAYRPLWAWRCSIEEGALHCWSRTGGDNTCWRNTVIWPRTTLCLLLQPGCVNTTEMDIRKCRRERNPHRVKKVRGGEEVKLKIMNYKSCSAILFIKWFH